MHSIYKIFLIIPTLKQGGAERVMSQLANQWTHEGHEVHIVLLVQSSLFYELNEKIILHELGFLNLGRLRSLISQIKIFFKLRSIFKEENPDFILSFMTKYNVFTILSSISLNLRVYVSDRSSPTKKLPTILNLLRNYLYRYATGIIAQTSLAKDVLEKTIINKNIKVIPNPIRVIEENSFIPKDKIILNIGRLIPEKGQKHLIESFSKIKDSSWKLVILGEGPLRRELEKQAESIGIKNKLYMPGSVQNVDSWIRKASIFAFPSISEGFPNALLEAMSGGLPCVSFDCDSGPKDVIKHGYNGFLIPVGDIEVFTKTIDILISNESLRMEIGSKAIITTSKFSTNYIAEQYLNFCKPSMS